MIAVADDIAAGGRPRCTLTRFDHRNGEVRWGDPLVSDDVGGWLVDTLTAPQDAVPSVQATVEELTAIAMRCVALGHELYYPCKESVISGTVPEPRAGRTHGPP